MRNVGNVTKKVAAAVLCGIMVLGAVACQSASESMQVTKDADFSMNGAWSGSTSMNVISEEMKMDVEYGMTSGTKPEIGRAHV